MNITETSSVLIVEDEQCIRDVLAELFDVDGARVETASNVGQAAELLATHQFNLILTDIRLGNRAYGGFQVMAAAGVLAPEATVVALTAFPDEDNRRAAERLGATHFLAKPVSLERIAEVAAAARVPTAMTPML